MTHRPWLSLALLLGARDSSQCHNGITETDGDEPASIVRVCGFVYVA